MAEQFGETVLMMGCKIRGRHCNLETIKYYVALGIDVNARSQVVTYSKNLVLNVSPHIYSMIYIEG